MHKLATSDLRGGVMPGVWLILMTSIIQPQAPGLLVGMPQASSDEHLIEMWLSKAKSDRTVEAYKKAITRLQRWLVHQFGVEPLQSVTAGYLMSYERSLPSHWSDATRNQHLAAIKSLWSFGIMLGYFPFNVGGILALGRPKPVLPERILSREEVLAAIEGEPRLEPALFMCLLFGTGVRCAEALALKWINLTEIGGSPRITVIKGKGNKTRVISCFRSCWDSLIQYREQSSVQLFEIDRRTAQRWVNNAFDRIGKRGVSPHWLRHASAIAMRQAGMDWPDIANQLGHADPSITLKAYAHLTESGHEVFEGL